MLLLNDAPDVVSGASACLSAMVARASTPQRGRDAQALRVRDFPSGRPRSERRQVIADLVLNYSGW